MATISGSHPFIWMFLVCVKWCKVEALKCLPRMLPDLMGYCTPSYSTYNFHPNFYVISISTPYSFSHWGLFSPCPCYEFYPDLASLTLGCWKDSPFTLSPSPTPFWASCFNILVLILRCVGQYGVNACLWWNQVGTQIIFLFIWLIHKQITSYCAAKYSLCPH